MSGATEKLIDRVNSSQALQAASRIGVPLLLAAAIGGTRFLVSLEHRVTVVESQRASAATDVARRLEVLDAADMRSREVDRRVSMLEQVRVSTTDDISRRLGVLEAADARDREITSQMRADVSALLAQQSAMLRALERVERAVDGRLRAGSLMEGGGR